MCRHTAAFFLLPHFPFISLPPSAGVYRGKCSLYGGTFDFLSVLPVLVIQKVVRGPSEMRKDGNRG